MTIDDHSSVGPRVRAEGVVRPLSLGEISLLQDRDLATLRRLLHRYGYSLEGLSRRVPNASGNPRSLISRSAWYSILYAERLRSSEDPADLLAGLFWMGASVEQERLHRGLRQPETQCLHDLGFLQPERGGLVRARVAVTEVEGRVFISDPLFANVGEGELVVSDVHACVMPPHASTLELWDHVGESCDGVDVLDVGCGSGALGIWADSRARSVTGFDVNPRAVAFGQANARINECAAKLSVANVMSPPSYLADVALYNAPWSPRMLEAAGDGADPLEALGALAGVVNALVRPGGVLYVSGSFEVRGGRGVLRDDLARKLPGCVVEYKLLTGSPYGISRAQVEAGKLPAPCYLVAPGEVPDELLAYLRAHAVEEVVKAIVKVRV